MNTVTFTFWNIPLAFTTTCTIIIVLKKNSSRQCLRPLQVFLQTQVWFSFHIEYKHKCPDIRSGNGWRIFCLFCLVHECFSQHLTFQTKTENNLYNLVDQKMHRMPYIFLPNIKGIKIWVHFSSEWNVFTDW